MIKLKSENHRKEDYQMRMKSIEEGKAVKKVKLKECKVICIKVKT